MGHKVNPKGFRIGKIYTWDMKWFAKGKDYADFLKQDILIKEYLKNKFKEAGVESVGVERSANAMTVIIKAAKPGIIIGRSGAGAEDLKKEIKKIFLTPKTNLNLNILEVERASTSAPVILQSMIADIEKRIPFRRVMKTTISRVERAGAKGIRVRIAGRLNGAEIARSETLFSGKIPLHTLRADIDFAQGPARTIYGAIGIKIWIYKGEIFKK